jgi:UDP-glucuronate 4-epimerase
MRALVTGCAGFVGSHLTEALLDRGASVVGIDCFNDNYMRAHKLRNLRHVADWDGFEFVPVDLARGDLEELVVDHDVIFHLAAEPGVRSSWGVRYERYLRNNVLATQHILEALRRTPETRLIHASSSSVYGEAELRPTPEEAPTKPLSPYGQTKLAAEQLCALYRANYGLDTVSLRYFTVFGPRQRPDMGFHVFCRAAILDEPLSLFGDGTQTRDFTYVRDVVDATLAASTCPLGDDRVFNIGGGTVHSIRDVLSEVEAISGKRLDVHYADRGQGEVRDTAADTSKAREQLDFAPRGTLRDGLLAQYEWLLAWAERDPGALQASSRL